MNTRLLICDMDGTVIDSMGVLSALGVALLSACSSEAECDARAHYHATVGQPFGDQLRAFANCIKGGSSIHRLVQSYEAVHLAAAPHFPFTDFGRALIELHDYHSMLMLALVTSTSRRIVDVMPQLHRVPWRFIGGYEGKGMEKEAQVYRCINQFRLTSLDDVVYVGDSVSDHEIADRVGLRFFSPTREALEEIIGRRAPTGSIFDKTPMPTAGMFRTTDPPQQDMDVKARGPLGIDT